MRCNFKCISSNKLTKVRTQTSSQKCIKQLINPILLFRYCISKTIFVRMTKIESYINRLIHVLLVLEVRLVLKTIHFHQVQRDIVFAIRRILFKRFYEIFISLTLVVWFEFKVALLNRYNCIHLIANTLVIVSNLFKTVFAWIIASFKTDLLSVSFLNMFGNVFVNII